MGGSTSDRLPWPAGGVARRDMPCRGLHLSFGRRTLLMGILNVTPDSFFDGGRYARPEAAVARGLELVEQGADILDVGGESTRPGADPVPPEVEIERVLPVIEGLRDRVQVPISIDTTKAAVARAALAAGAHLINDVGALRLDPDMAAVAAEAGAPVVLMHMQGTPRTMQADPSYQDVVGEVGAFLAERLEAASRAGIPRHHLLVDPGIGFGKTVAHNLALLRCLANLRELGCPVVLGTSRKSFIGHVLGLPVAERMEGTAATIALGIAGGADVVRVHDVAFMRRVARMSDAIVRDWSQARCFLGLGSNLGDRERHLREAIRRLHALPGTRVVRLSGLYETEPVGKEDQAWFLNLVAEIRTDLPPLRLLAEAMAIERALGRVRSERWGPRTADIDILLYDAERIDHPQLVVPHPRLEERGFVLVPLAEIAPDLAWNGRTAAERAAAWPGDKAVNRRGVPRGWLSADGD